MEQLQWKLALVSKSGAGVEWGAERKELFLHPTMKTDIG